MTEERKKKKSKPGSLLCAKPVDPRGCELPLNISHGSHSALCSPAESPAVKRRAVSGPLSPYLYRAELPRLCHVDRVRTLLISALVEYVLVVVVIPTPGSEL